MQRCGACAFWNGSVVGGGPALADPYASTLHPLVAVPTLLLGVPAGAKLALAGALFMAGVAQWWMGRVLGLGRVACLWSGAMAVVAGNLAGRMDPGRRRHGGLHGGLCPHLAPAATREPYRQSAIRRRAGSRAGSGGGLRSGLHADRSRCFALPVLTLCLLPSRVPLLPVVIRRYALAVGIALLLAAPMLLPFARFQPYFYKDTDTSYEERAAVPVRSAQPGHQTIASFTSARASDACRTRRSTPTTSAGCRC